MTDPGIFVSSIKIKGTQFLPPVINPTRRAEIERDRQQAIKLEKRLLNNRKLKNDLDDLLSIPKISNLSQSVKSHRENNFQIPLHQITSPRCTDQLKKKVNLSKLIVDVSEYGKDGIKLIDKDFGSVRESLQGHTDFGTQGSDTDTLSNITDASSSKTCEISGFSLTSKSNSSKGSSLVQCPLLDLSNISNGTTTETQTPSPRKSPKARLIRSNSYTLEAPSPILLAHLEKFGKTANQDRDQIEVPAMSRTWASLENNYVPFEQSEFSSLNTVYHFNDKPEASDKIGDIQHVPEKDCTKDPSPTIEVIQTDISVQQITVNANTDRVEPVKTTLDLTDPDCQLMEVLKKIPEDYSRQIVELIEKQRSEHNVKVDSFAKQFNRNAHCSTPMHDDDKSNISVVSASPSQSIYYSLGSSDTIMPSTPLGKMTDLDTCREEGSVNGDFSRESLNRDLYERGARQQDDTRGAFGRKVFSSNYGDIDSIKKEWAACVISAHVKGYLTRRLLKTDRVQSLIETIRDALLCALQLHNVENIDEADIELHRRLINQVSAACYEFHDIFFSLSITDKMSVISADRKKRIEKERRSKSGSDLRRSVSNSSRSSTRSVASLTSSLTKI